MGTAYTLTKRGEIEETESYCLGAAEAHGLGKQARRDISVRQNQGHCRRGHTLVHGRLGRAKKKSQTGGSPYENKVISSKTSDSYGPLNNTPQRKVRDSSVWGNPLGVWAMILLDMKRYDV